jgi:hypothetical protein
MPILMTSLAEIASFNPCGSGWRDILKGQKKIGADNVLFPLVNCVDSNPVTDCLLAYWHAAAYAQKQKNKQFLRDCINEWNNEE